MRKETEPTTPKPQINLNLSITATTEELRDSIRKVLPFVDACEGITITIAGFDFDRRELWQIPEVCAFAKMLVSEGFLGIMKCPSLTGHKIDLGPLLGGPSVFLISRGVNIGNGIIDRPMMDDYVQGVRDGNAIIAERYGR